ncbi:DUF4397 domain-containing protein [Flavobacterium pectinovorum]|uniref:DUF4397 domain-containing protein n=1 Tax=Flavobacterium pectinovorum TaxID=29533 RepID=A0AB36NX91_9FLAO|nr:DUF4397 domain-containing protein [Flavobacterium pectinovorum]OXB02357.1 hypothetical protein B0A72_17045 [Flavobacterium pectinovorum]SHM37662.1 protein of unknown function [Flavobacterium pectinovorum]
MKIKRALTLIPVKIIAIATLVIMSSCDNNEVDPFGSARLKVVNAAPNAGSQKFVMANIPYIGNLSYLEHSVSYHDVAVGNNLVSQFRDENDNDLYASEELDLDDDKRYTVYLTGESRDDAEVRLYEDNVSAPSSGKAKIKFIHLSSGAPVNIDFLDGQGNTLSSNLARYSQSGYSEINAGSVSVQVRGTGGSENLATLSAIDFAAGKVYTVFISGSSSSGYTVTQLSQN